VIVKAASAFYQNPKRTIEKLLTGRSAVSGRLNSLAGRSAERS